MRWCRLHDERLRESYGKAACRCRIMPTVWPDRVTERHWSFLVGSVVWEPFGPFIYGIVPLQSRGGETSPGPELKQVEPLLQEEQI